MRIYTGISLLLAVMLTVTSAEPVCSQGIKGKEILGIRLGGVITKDELHDNFGSGSEIELHFIEGLASWFGINVALSAHNLGESKNQIKDIAFTGSDMEVNLHIYSATAALFAMKPLGKRIVPTLEAGLGLYTITSVIPTGYYEGHKTENQYGFYGGAGLMVRLTKGLSLNVNGKYHYIISGDKHWDVIHFYTGSDRAELYQITVGVIILTG